MIDLFIQVNGIKMKHIMSNSVFNSFKTCMDRLNSLRGMTEEMFTDLICSPI